MKSSARLFRGPLLQTDVCGDEGTLSPKPLLKVDPLTSHVFSVFNGFLPKYVETESSWFNLRHTSGFSIYLQIISLSNSVQYNFVPSFCTDTNLQTHDNTTTSYSCKSTINHVVRVESLARNLVRVGVTNSDTDFSAEFRFIDGYILTLRISVHHTKNDAKVIMAITGANYSGDDKVSILLPDFEGDLIPANGRKLAISRFSNGVWHFDIIKVTKSVESQSHRNNIQDDFSIQYDSISVNQSGNVSIKKVIATSLSEFSSITTDFSMSLEAWIEELHLASDVSLEKTMDFLIRIQTGTIDIPLSIEDSFRLRNITDFTHIQKLTDSIQPPVLLSVYARVATFGRFGPLVAYGSCSTGQDGPSFKLQSVPDCSLIKGLDSQAVYNTIQYSAIIRLNTRCDKYILPKGLGQLVIHKICQYPLASNRPGLTLTNGQDSAIFLGLGPEPAELELQLDDMLPDPALVHAETEAINSAIIDEFMQISSKDRRSNSCLTNSFGKNISHTPGSKTSPRLSKYSEPSSPPDELVSAETGVDFWGWKLLEYENPEDILENIEGQPFEVNNLMDSLLEQAEQPVELVPPRDNDQIQIMRGYDSDSGSFGGSIHDPSAPWLPQDTSLDSGTDDRMVNLPVYYNQHNDSISSSQLDYENWQDIFAPNLQQWGQHWDNVSDSSSDYGPLGELLGELNTSTTPSIPSLASSPPVSPPWPAMAAQPDASTPRGLDASQSPVFVHLEGCNCLRCIRHSPGEGYANPTYSYPVDLAMVAKRLLAHIESVNLLVDVDLIHWNADLEVENMVAEYYYQQSDKFIEDEIVFWNESEGHIGLHDIQESIEKDEQELVNTYWRYVQSSDTHEMVARYSSQHAQDRWERRQLENAPNPDELDMDVVGTLSDLYLKPDQKKPVVDFCGGRPLLGYKQEKPP